MTLFTPGQTALILIDFQGAVRQHAAEPYPADDIVAKGVRLVEAARAGGALVVYVRTSFLPDESDSLATRKIDLERGAPHRFEGWDQLVEELQPLPTEPVIIKRSWNAFHGSDLDLQLRRHGISTIVMAGISTNFGVEGTARAGYEHGYDVIFVEDAMSSTTAENHDFAVRAILPQLGRLRSLETVLTAFSAELAPTS